ncbi:MAG: ATP-binding protein, partial [bacterium]|nr:ATP-binding protein [bacterium]
RQDEYPLDILVNENKEIEIFTSQKRHLTINSRLEQVNEEHLDYLVLYSAKFRDNEYLVVSDSYIYLTDLNYNVKKKYPIPDETKLKFNDYMTYVKIDSFILENKIILIIENTLFLFDHTLQLKKMFISDSIILQSELVDPVSGDQLIMISDGRYLSALNTDLELVWKESQPLNIKLPQKLIGVDHSFMCDHEKNAIIFLEQSGENTILLKREIDTKQTEKICDLHGLPSTLSKFNDSFCVSITEPSNVRPLDYKSKLYFFNKQMKVENTLEVMFPIDEIHQIDDFMFLYNYSLYCAFYNKNCEKICTFRNLRYFVNEFIFSDIDSDNDTDIIFSGISTLQNGVKSLIIFRNNRNLIEKDLIDSKKKIQESISKRDYVKAITLINSIKYSYYALSLDQTELNQQLDEVVRLQRRQKSIRNYLKLFLHLIFIILLILLFYRYIRKSFFDFFIRIRSELYLRKYYRLRKPQDLEAEIIQELDLDFIHEVPKYLLGIKNTITGIADGSLEFEKNRKYLESNIQAIVKKLKTYSKSISLLIEIGKINFNLKLFTRKVKLLFSEVSSIKKKNDIDLMYFNLLIGELEILTVNTLKNELNKEKFSFLDLIEDSVSNILAEKCVYKEKNRINLKVDYPGNKYFFYNKRLMRPEYELGQSFLINILRNSFDAFEGIEDDRDKYITLKADNDKTSIILSITDNASGMEREAVESFTKLGYTTKDTGSGMGITEERIKELKDRLNMRLEIDSDLGKGTKMTLYFPI